MNNRWWQRPPLLVATLWAALLASCSNTPLPDSSTPAASQPDPSPASQNASSSPSAQRAGPPPPSQASTAKAYRQDAAKHLYQLNGDRLYSGKLPPMLYAVGVLQVHIDRHGQVSQLHWMRAPRHAPEVISEIERTVRRAAPYPVPARLGTVVYTDTWLWDKSGRFQLDTLTEGQL
ncbi:hypothetical protein PSQ20_09440 [Curvibacter sp. RS43]|jgi:protein TonB|uniref:hypothetical protein n=1 Tax=Curvibacter microcysteis TaxID=3026419 RepID=UPI0023610665|nr:hypothetical protein [Curvibacter sp. RS43]MDD0810557.1 hypothetical protein [Curvibacter sp. RS43]